MFDEWGSKVLARGGKPVRRQGSPPCGTCPKKSPEQARHYELNGRNKATLDLYYATRAMGGANLTDEQRRDSVLQSALAVIDRIVRPYEAEQATAGVLAQMRVADLQRDQDLRSRRVLR